MCYTPEVEQLFCDAEDLLDAMYYGENIGPKEVIIILREIQQLLKQQEEEEP